MIAKKSVVIGGRELSIETGKVARQASGSAWIQYGETIVLVTATADTKPIEDRGFVPLTVDYREKAYAAGKIPGGFFKREGRPTEKETLSARLIDRPIRTLFNEGFKYESMLAINVLSSDQENDSDVLGIIGSAAALAISEIPFETTVGAIRVGKINGELVANPTFEQLKDSKMEIIVAASKDSIIMVEGVANEISEEELSSALEFAHKAVQPIIEIIDELAKEVSKEKRALVVTEVNEELKDKVEKIAEPLIKEALQEKEKLPRYKNLDGAKDKVAEALEEEYPEDGGKVKLYFGELKKNITRALITGDGKRLDGRGNADIRPITCEVGVLPRTHGSALFTRGETQSLAVVTLGSKEDEQRVEALEGQSWSRYMLHYNFPPFSVGEVGFPRGPGRREIGHGKLAEKALEYAIPAESDFPYTIRIVSEIFESNGSSSMASICAGSMALMDAGVPVAKQSAGIAMGLIKEGDDYFILSDILGDEDHLGDMDFKLAGSKDGFTAIQMDIKIKGISIDVMKKAIAQARQGIDHILGEIDKTINVHRDEMSPYAPKILIFKINTDEIGAVIGPGGKVIRDIQERTDSTISIEDDGTVVISAVGAGNAEAAKAIVDKILEVPEVGKVYPGTVKKITDFGAFVEILPGKDGLLHISEISNKRIAKVSDVLKLGEAVEVKVKKIDRGGKVDLTRKYQFTEGQ